MEFPTTAKALWDLVRNDLTLSREEPEADTEAYWLLEHYFGLSRTDVLVDKTLPQADYSVLESAVDRLHAHEPIQYILGEAWFYGRPFSVNENVLIPRPETEELVQQILQLPLAEQARVLDVGTGSGCIPITLAAERPSWEVHALDISEEALTVARANAQALEVSVAWYRVDVLMAQPPVSGVDVLVSNPPYVRMQEMEAMAPKVTDYEPPRALFVPDSAPLLFYERLTFLAPRLLAPGGWLATEINEALGPEVAELYRQAGLQQVKLLQDMQGKDRMVLGQWEG